MIEDIKEVTGMIGMKKNFKAMQDITNMFCVSQNDIHLAYNQVDCNDRFLFSILIVVCYMI